ncbi:MAG TPA: sialate O-acetylesterase [Candidatus Limisoma intestinavium]|uniref:Sialate O-acetylesterase n=1 Tax=Candidatus Limisoma intestinavium TaxID=2840856 RepID=A0A9D1LGJ2_9BACT|nr:sialate O-acetylesterase [Candidatus Limisoma intestinavium]
MRNVFIAVALFLGVGMMSAQEKYEYNEFYYQRATLFEELPIAETDIVFLGDSQTNGCEWHELLANPNVKNRGISSDVIQGFADRVDPVIKGKPAKVFILGGVNDISHNLTPDSIATAMEALIVKIKTGTPRTKIYLQSLLPIDNSFNRYKAMAGKEQVIVETNALLKEVAARQGVTWIDLYSKMVDPSTGSMKKGLTNDGLHLMGAGYLVWRDAVLPYVNE